jgi:hypothetical protein
MKTNTSLREKYKKCNNNTVVVWNVSLHNKSHDCNILGTEDQKEGKTTALHGQESRQALSPCTLAITIIWLNT